MISRTDEFRLDVESIQNGSISLSKKEDIDGYIRAFKEANIGYILFRQEHFLRDERYKHYAYFLPLKKLTKLLERKDVEILEIYRPEN